MRGELETEQNWNILTPTLMAIAAFLSRSPELLNRGPGGPASLGHGPHSSILTPTDSIFLSPGLYNNLTSTLLPASVTISHSIQPLDSQGYILIFLERIQLLFTQVHFLFWQLGRVGGQYTTPHLPNYILKSVYLPKIHVTSRGAQGQFLNGVKSVKVQSFLLEDWLPYQV